MGRRPLSTVAVLGMLFVAIEPVAAGDDDDQVPEIDTLIQDLGHKEYDVRDAAEKRLILIGRRVVPALKKAMESDNPEVALRARRAHACLTNATAGEWEAIRHRAEASFSEAKYEEAAALYGRLADQKTPLVDHLIWLGHAWQLAGDWRMSVAGYRLALERVDFLRDHPEVPAKPRLKSRGGRRGFEGERDRPRGAFRGRGLVDKRRPAVRSERDTRALERQGVQLRLLIGLIEREEIGDLKAAAATFAEGAGRCDILKRTVPQLLREYEDHLRRRIAGEKIQHEHLLMNRLSYPFWCLKELATTQERMGQAAEPLATWDKVRLVRHRYGTGSVVCDIAAMGRLFGRLSADKPLPEITSLLVMSPEKERYSLDISDPKLLARAYATPYTQGAHYWKFACSAPPALEFAALEVSCDIEQHALRYGGQFSCWVKPLGGGRSRISVGGIGWPKDRPTGREVITGRFDVPAGAGPIYIQSGSWKGKFTIHGITIKPTFRPRAKDGVAPIAKVWIQNQALPKGGTLTYDGKKVGNDSAKDDFPAGPHTFAYKVGRRKDGKEFKATLLPGGRYGLFINLDSPFATMLTNLRHFSEHPPARSSIVRLPDGRWLVAYVSTGGQGYAAPLKIMLSTSKGLVTWDDPWPLSHNAIFVNQAPSLVVDAKGTIWLAWFSNRLHLERFSSAGCRLWLTHSRDGKTWSRPTPVDCGPGNVRPELHMARGPEGKYWMFSSGRVGSADSPGGIRRLSPISVQGMESRTMATPHVVWDSEKRMHMVYVESSKTIRYATSRDGKRWTNPMVLLAENEGGSVANPQLILAGQRLAVIYEDRKGTWLLRRLLNGDPEGGGKTKNGAKITHHVIPMNGSRLSLTPGGRLVVLAGSDTVWLLHGELDEIMRAVSPHE